MRTYSTYREYIQGLRGVAQTVRATEKVAASHVHALKTTVEHLSTYEKALEALVHSGGITRRGLSMRSHNGGNKKRCAVILTADRGLVGALWHNVVAAFLEKKESYAEVITVGSRGRAILTDNGVTVARHFDGFMDRIDATHSAVVTHALTEYFLQGRCGSIDVVYPQFHSVAQQHATIVTVLPIDEMLFSREGGDQSMNRRSDPPLFLSRRRDVSALLVEKVMALAFHKVIVEAKLSELAARTVAMEHAAAKTDALVQKHIALFARQRRRLKTQRQTERFTAHKIV